MATENVKVIKVDTNAAQTSVKDLRNELKELRSTMLSTEQGTEEYNKALLRSAEIQHTLKEQMEEINASAMDFGQISSNLVKATGGLVAGFQAATAAMNLFGIENEDVLKAMQKMQSLMAITQALPSIDSGIKAFRRLGIAIKGAVAGMNTMKAALISTGIGAAVVAVGLLAANWDKVTAAINGALGKQKEFSSEDRKTAVSNYNDELQRQINLLRQLGKIEGKSESEILKDTNESYKEQKTLIEEAIQAKKDYDATQRREPLAPQGAATKEIWKQYSDALKQWQADVNQSDIRLDKWNEKAKEVQISLGLDKPVNDLETLQELLDGINNKIKETGKNIEDAEKIETAQSSADAKKKLETEINNLINAYQGLLAEIELYGKTDTEKAVIKLEEEEKAKTKIVQDNLNKRLITTEEAEAQIAKIHEHYQGLITETQNKEEEERRKKEAEEIQNRLNFLKDWVNDAIFNYSDAFKQLQVEEDNELTLLEESYNKQVISQETYEQLKTDIQQKYADERERIAREEAEKEAEIQQQKLSTYLSIAGNFADILSGIAGTMDEENDKQFETAKAFNISAAIISTIAGAIGAYTGAASNAGINAIPMVGPALAQALGITNAIAVAATGAAQIAQLSRTKFGDKNFKKDLFTPATPNTGAVNSIIAPVQYTQDVQGASIEGAIKDTKVYVTETDITNTQNKVKVTENEARF